VCIITLFTTCLLWIRHSLPTTSLSCSKQWTRQPPATSSTVQLLKKDTIPMFFIRSIEMHCRAIDSIGMYIYILPDNLFLLSSSPSTPSIPHKSNQNPEITDPVQYSCSQPPSRSPSPSLVPVRSCTDLFISSVPPKHTSQLIDTTKRIITYPSADHTDSPSIPHSASSQTPSHSH
jgi:hypothetical protein